MDVVVQEIQIVVIVLANDFPKLLAVPLLTHLCALFPLRLYPCNYWPRGSGLTSHNNKLELTASHRIIDSPFGDDLITHRQHLLITRLPLKIFPYGSAIFGYTAPMP